MDQSAMPAGATERWLPVAGWEGWYEVSDLGRVRSVTRYLEVQMPYGKTTRRYRGRILKPHVGPGTHGYPTAGLSRHTVHDNRLVHQLVMEAFVGPCPEGMEVRHGLGGKLDARLVNLCYGTRSENVRDRTRDGHDNRGERSGHAKLTWVAVADIRARVARGEMQCRLAYEYGVSEQTITDVKVWKSWRYPPAA